MISDDTARLPTFNWTEEERALLQRTLRVKVLAEDRIEVEARVAYEPIAELVGWVVVLSAITLLAHEAFDPAAAGLAWVYFLGTLVAWGIPFGLIQRLRGSLASSVSFFPGTRWCIRHRSSGAGSLETISLEVSRPFWGVFRQQLVFETDVGCLQLAKSGPLRYAAAHDCHNLLLGRLQGKPHSEGFPPPDVQSWAEAGAFLIPRRAYLLLLRNLSVVTVGADALAVQTEVGIFRRFWTVYAADLIIWLTLTALPEVGVLPENLPWGAGPSTPVRYLALLGIPIAIGLLQRAWIKRTLGPERREVMTISRRSDVIVIRGPRGERSINRSDLHLTLLSGADGSADDLLVQEGKKKLARWPLADLDRLGSDTQLIFGTIASYLWPANREERQG